MATCSKLGVTQPALTKSLHELEDILQLRLFGRRYGRTGESDKTGRSRGGKAEA